MHRIAPLIRYLALVQTGLGFAMPIVADEADWCEFGLVDFWAGLTEEAWAHFASDENFGKEYGGIRALHGRSQSQWVAKHVHSAGGGQFPYGITGMSPPSRLAERIVDAGSSASQRLRRYAERFAHFFTQGFFVRKCFEALHSELKPEHAGFRRAAATLFSEYRAVHGIEAPTLVEYVYDEMCLELDVEAVACFFGWCGLLQLTPTQRAKLTQLKAAVDASSKKAGEEEKHAKLVAEEAKKKAQTGAAGGAASTSAATTSAISACISAICQPSAEDADPRVCPICFEMTGDVTPVKHLDPPVGDASSHRMCRACRQAWGQSICPFCKEVTTAAELVGFIQGFIRTVSSSTHDANASAAVLETIQLFEMEHEGQPSVIRRVYKMIAEDAELGAQIDAALKAQHEWPRDMAGVFWRLDCAAEAGELKGLEPTARMRLQSVVAAIWRPFERGAREPNELDPHYHGALYTQALVAWLCAWRSGMATDGLVAVVQRCGRNLVEWRRTTKMHKDSCTGRVRERLHTEYLQLSHEPIWGSRDADPVWQAFYK